jgi:hypothetical protein
MIQQGDYPNRSMKTGDRVRSEEPEKNALGALARLIADAKADKVTGNGFIRLEFSAGGIRTVRTGIERIES